MTGSQKNESRWLGMVGCAVYKVIISEHCGETRIYRDKELGVRLKSALTERRIDYIINEAFSRLKKDEKYVITILDHKDSKKKHHLLVAAETYDYRGENTRVFTIVSALSNTDNLIVFKDVSLFNRIIFDNTMEEILNNTALMTQEELIAYDEGIRISIGPKVKTQKERIEEKAEKARVRKEALNAIKMRSDAFQKIEARRKELRAIEDNAMASKGIEDEALRPWVGKQIYGEASLTTSSKHEGEHDWTLLSDVHIYATSARNDIICTLSSAWVIIKKDLKVALEEGRDERVLFKSVIRTHAPTADCPLQLHYRIGKVKINKNNGGNEESAA